MRLVWWYSTLAGVSAVVATLRLQFAHTLTLGVAIGDVFSRTAEQGEAQSWCGTHQNQAGSRVCESISIRSLCKTSGRYHVHRHSSRAVGRRPTVCCSLHDVIILASCIHHVCLSNHNDDFTAQVQFAYVGWPICDIHVHEFHAS